MPHRSASAEIHRPGINQVDDSDFTPSSARDRPKIPVGLDRSVRKRVVSLLDQNIYLGDAQMSAVIRLAQMYERFDALESEIQAAGLKIFSEVKGMDLPNPMIATQLSVQSHIVTQERNLAISIPTRHEQIDKADRKTRKKPAEKKRGAPTLRIA